MTLGSPGSLRLVTMEFCENGAKATAWEITSRRADRGFFAAHTLHELEEWSDHDLEEQGRLTHPMRWNSANDKYEPVSWSDAFEEIGRELRALAPQQVDFYTSGRASLETAYMPLVPVTSEELRQLSAYMSGLQ